MNSIIRLSNPYRVNTTHYLHNHPEDETGRCNMKLVVMKESVDYTSDNPCKQIEVATYYTRVLAGIQEVLDIYQKIDPSHYVEVHLV